MMNILRIVAFCVLIAGCQSSGKKAITMNDFSGRAGEVKLIVLNPGHFHAGLLLKNRIEQVNDSVFVYSSQGVELDHYLSRIESYNHRPGDHTQWKEVVYVGDDFLEKMVSDKSGNVVVLAGNNKEKTHYIFESVAAGLNVLADKPMAINKENFELLERSFDSARAHNVLLYDMMTERYDILNIVERKLINNKELFGELQKGSENEPAIFMESVHHYYKEVSGTPLIRPAWYYDVEQQGEGITDITTHLIDLVHWKCFPEESLNYNQDIQVVSASHWATELSLQEFSRSTKLDAFPEYLKKDVENSRLKVFANGTIQYQVKGVNVGLKVVWNYQAPQDGGDTFSAYIKGSKATLTTVQDKSHKFVKQLYIKKSVEMDQTLFHSNLEDAILEIQKDYPNISIKSSSSKPGEYLIDIPLDSRESHESHFGYVAQAFFNYLVDGNLPEWEISNTLAKYYITTTALQLAKGNK